MVQPESIFVTTTAKDTADRPWLTSNFRRVIRAGKSYAGSDFVLSDNPERADYILFVDSSDRYLKDVRRSQQFRKTPEKCCVYNINDAAVPVLPGIYPDMRAPTRCPDWQLGGFYIRCFDNKNLVGYDYDTAKTAKYLFSFMGNVANSSDLRHRIVSLTHDRALLVDKSSNMQDNDVQYTKSLKQSLFVICPKGIGPTSWRFYETMMAGSVPVIVSNDWLPARGFDWKEFSIHVKEDEVHRIPKLCASMEDNAVEMGKLARDQWDRNCSVSQAFGWIGQRLKEIRESQPYGNVSDLTNLYRELIYRRELTKFFRVRLGGARTFLRR